MIIVNQDKLKNMSIRADVIDTYISEWKKGDKFNKYQKTKRPFSALFFVLSDMELEYIEINEIGKKVCSTKAKKGDILYLPANILYHVVFSVKDNSAPPTTFTVNFRLFDSNEEELLLDKHVILLKNQVNRYMNEDIINLHRCMTNPISYDRIRINSIYFSILYYATRSRIGGNNVDSIKRAVQAIENEWNLNKKMEI